MIILLDVMRKLTSIILSGLTSALSAKRASSTPKTANGTSEPTMSPHRRRLWCTATSLAAIMTSASRVVTTWGVISETNTRISLRPNDLCTTFGRTIWNYVCAVTWKVVCRVNCELDSEVVRKRFILPVDYLMPLFKHLLVVLKAVQISRYLKWMLHGS
jgi:hypothetical protein